MFWFRLHYRLRSGQPLGIKDPFADKRGKSAD